MSNQATTQANPWAYNATDAKPCWPQGFYKAQLWHAEVKPRPKTQDDTMLAVTFKVWNGKQTQLLTDHFTHEQVGLNRYKRLAKALGREDEFKAGNFYAGNHNEAPLVLFLNVEESEQYGDGNKVGGYESPTFAPDADHALKGYAFPDFPDPKGQRKASDFK